MLNLDNSEFTIKCQQYDFKDFIINQDETEVVLLFESGRKTEDASCPYCSGKVNIDGWTTKSIKDMPLWAGIKQELCFICHRYRCVSCRRKFTEEIPNQYPGTRLTKRAANWIKCLLRNKVSIRAVQNMTGIHWGTIRKIQQEMMEKTLRDRTEELKKQNYHPKYLAVDEFAIHKGHTYATCVMDLENGEVLWVGKGRSKADFAKFFEEIEPSFITDVMAVAMDMNASYYLLFQEKLPQAQIVFDRYHMQAQFGKDVLGVVRLNEARKHNARAKELKKSLSSVGSQQKRALKEEIKQEQKQYSQIKKLRWTLLTNGDKLSKNQTAHLNEILDNHSDLAVCYAMKEELCRLFTLRNPTEAETAWKAWFQAAKESGIDALVHFADLKEKHIAGLIAHATFPISTGKLEGFNNKIKVAKRVGYGYRDDEFFFLLVRFISLPQPNFS